MKNRIHLSLLAALALPMLAGCGSKGTTLPTTAKEKVAFAFEGVEKSLRTQRGGQKNLPIVAKDKKPTDSVIAELFSFMDEETETENPEFPYDEPPMMQFQYIKALYQAIGDDFTFGTIYSETITGTINYDFATAETTKKQNYSMNLMLDITIDAKDLIVAHCGMDILYRDEQSVEHRQLFYADMELDYDMSRQDPNYTLGMYYVDDGSSFPDEEAFATYEYDYAQVVDGKISEWRKASLSTDVALDMDAAHPNFSTYLEDPDLKINVSARGYKNGTMYHATKTGNSNPEHVEPRKRLATLLVDKLGCNGKEIPYRSFFSSTTTHNGKVTEVYRAFCRALGSDICANIVYSGIEAFRKDEGPDIEATGIGFFYSTDMTRCLIQNAYSLASDCLLIDLFRDESVYQYSPHGLPKLCFINEEGSWVADLPLSEAEFYVPLSGEESTKVDLETTSVSSFAEALGQERTLLLTAIYYPDGDQRKELYVDAIVFDVSSVIGGTEQSTSSEPGKEDGSDSQGSSQSFINAVTAVGTWNDWDLTLNAIYFTKTEDGFEAHFAVSSGDEFKFVLNNDWSEGSYGYAELGDRGYPALLGEGSQGNFLALKHIDLQVRVKVASDGELTFVFDQVDELDYDPRPDDTPVTSISLIGSFNSWDEKSGSHDLLPLQEQNFMGSFDLADGDKFKFVVNHNWTFSFGYSRVSFIGPNVEKVFAGDNDDNIEVVRPCRISVTASATSRKSVAITIEVVDLL